MIPLTQTKSEESLETCFVVYDSDCPICSRFIKLLDRLYANSSHQLIVAPSVHSLTKCKEFKGVELGQMQLAHLSGLQSRTMIFIDSCSRYYLYSRAVLALIALSDRREFLFLSKIFQAFPQRLLDYVYKWFSDRRLTFSKFIGIEKACLLSCISIKLIDQSGNLTVKVPRMSHKKAY